MKPKSPPCDAVPHSNVGTPHRTSNPAGDRLMTVKEVADYLSLSVLTVYGLDIPRIQLGSRSIRFRQSSVEQWLAEREDVR